MVDIAEDPMQWLNEPASWQRTDDVLRVSVDPGTDFWRATGYGYIHDNGHVYGEVLPGDLDVSVRVRSTFAHQYDQAGIMLRADERTWLKTGVEFFEGRPRLSTVLTLGWSSWMVADLPADPDEITLRVSRRGDAVEVRYTAGERSAELAALVFLPPDRELLAGIVCAAPEGSGFSVTFHDLRIAGREWAGQAPGEAADWAEEPAPALPLDWAEEPDRVGTHDWAGEPGRAGARDWAEPLAAGPAAGWAEDRPGDVAGGWPGEPPSGVPAAWGDERPGGTAFDWTKPLASEPAADWERLSLSAREWGDSAAGPADGKPAPEPGGTAGKSAAGTASKSAGETAGKSNGETAGKSAGKPAGKDKNKKAGKAPGGVADSLADDKTDPAMPAAGPAEAAPAARKRGKAKLPVPRPPAPADAADEWISLLTAADPVDE